jgi:hypothetical protein
MTADYSTLWISDGFQIEFWVDEWYCGSTAGHTPPHIYLVMTHPHPAAPAKPLVYSGCKAFSVLVWGVGVLAFQVSNGHAVESVHFGFDSTNAALTDAIRLSTRTGTNWWSLNTPRLNPENLTPLPYAYHDGYVELIGVSKTPAEAADRWFKIKNGLGDPWTGATPLEVGLPSLILLDEITTSFKDSGQGPALQEALSLYLTNAFASRSDIAGIASRSVSLTPNNNLYTNVIYCASNSLRWLALELYATQQGFVTGYERDQPTVFRGTNDAYLINRYVTPIHRWLEAGIPADRLLPIFTTSNYGDANGTTDKPFYKFLNREFWVCANGWFTNDHSLVDSRIATVLRNGVGSYSWSAGTGTWNVPATETNRDSYFESYVNWYCVNGRTDPHPDGVDAVALPPFTISFVRAFNGTNTITWQSTPGTIYRAQRRGALGSGDWTNLTPDVTASGYSTSLKDAPASSQMFYRIMALY